MARHKKSQDDFSFAHADTRIQKTRRQHQRLVARAAATLAQWLRQTKVVQSTKSTLMSVCHAVSFKPADKKFCAAFQKQIICDFSVSLGRLISCLFFFFSHRSPLLPAAVFLPFGRRRQQPTDA
jgi:hypothetical protein